jgi:hypothetical protein
MKRAEHSTPLHQPKEVPSQPPADPAEKHPRDARNDAGAAPDDAEARKLKENKKALGVDKDHRTDAMKKGHRGTFP